VVVIARRKLSIKVNELRTTAPSGRKIPQRGRILHQRRVCLRICSPVLVYGRL